MQYSMLSDVLINCIIINVRYAFCSMLATVCCSHITNVCTFSIFVVFNCGCLVNIFMIIELVQGKGVSTNSCSRIKRSEEQYEEVEQVDGYETIEDNEVKR